MKYFNIRGLRFEEQPDGTWASKPPVQVEGHFAVITVASGSTERAKIRTDEQ